MHIGKLTNDELQEIVISRLPQLSSRTISGAQIGADCAWTNLGSSLLVTTSDPVTAGGMQSGRLAIHVSCNDIASCGAKPFGIMLVIIAPEKTSKEELIKIIDQASETAAMLGVDIIGGHTEISDAVTRVVVTTTALGHIQTSDMVPAGKAIPGDSLLMTKTAAIEGTWIAAMEHQEKLNNLVTDLELAVARSFIDRLSVVREGVLAVSCPPFIQSQNSLGYSLSAVHLMHDATEGGIYGAAYEMAALSGTGLIVDSFSIPVHPVTKTITSVLGIDVMRMISSGSLLIATSEPDIVKAKLIDNGIMCTGIGTFTQNGFSIRDQYGKLSPLIPPSTDEIYKLI